MMLHLVLDMMLYVIKIYVLTPLMKSVHVILHLFRHMMTFTLYLRSPEIYGTIQSR